LLELEVHHVLVLLVVAVVDQVTTLGLGLLLFEVADSCLEQLELALVLLLLDL
jgi:hypothetical protein